MSEQKLQSIILKWLIVERHYCFKVIVANRSGILDIIGCTHWGQFFGIEVKVGYNKLSKLQEYNIREINKAGGIAFVAYDLETVKAKLIP